MEMVGEKEGKQVHNRNQSKQTGCQTLLKLKQLSSNPPIYTGMLTKFSCMNTYVYPHLHKSAASVILHPAGCGKKNYLYFWWAIYW